MSGAKPTDAETGETTRTNEQHRRNQSHAERSWLEHPLLGLNRRRTGITLAYLAILTGLFAVSYAGTTVTVTEQSLDSVLTYFDTVSAVLIALATATMTILPFCYAVWNGGPALATGMALLPVVLGKIAAGQYVLTVDAVIGLTVGSAACVLAVFAADIRHASSLRPWRTTRIDTMRLLFVTTVTSVAAIGVIQFIVTTTPRSLEWYAPFSVLWLVTLSLVGVYWQAAVRDARTTESADDTVFLD